MSDDGKDKDSLNQRVGRRFNFLNYLGLAIFVVAAILTLFK